MAHVGLWKRYQYVADSLKDLEEALAIGNHKGVEQNPKILKDPGALLAPMNVMKQNSIDECGKNVEKYRLTHDQSYKWGIFSKQQGK